MTERCVIEKNYNRVVKPVIVIDTLTMLFTNRTKLLYLYGKVENDKDKAITYEQLSTMSFKTVIDILETKRLYIAKSTPYKEITKKLRTNVIRIDKAPKHIDDKFKDGLKELYKK